MIMKEYSAFSKAPGLLKPHHQIVWCHIQDTQWSGVGFSVRQWPGRLGFPPRSSHSRLKKCYLIPPCLTLCILRYGSRVKWSNPGNGVAPSPTPWCSSYWKRSLRVALDYGRQFNHLQRCSRRILQPQPSGLRWFVEKLSIYTLGHHFKCANLMTLSIIVDRTKEPTVR